MLNKIKSYFHSVYRQEKEAYLGDKADNIPEKYWSQFVCVGRASDAQYQLSKIIPKNVRRILVVGIFGGRDYFYLRSAGYDVYGLDLFADSDFDKLTVGNVEDIKLSQKFFDVIVIAATIEHVADDYKTLLNLRGALRDSGRLIICFPLHSDTEKTHIHIYSEKSMHRLLNSAGFSPVAVFRYPNLFFCPQFFNYPIHFFNWFPLF